MSGMPLRLAARVALCLAACTLAGCATEGVHGELHLGMEDAPEGKRLLWPQPPEVPRYLYVGTLTGEQNFRSSQSSRSGLSSVLRWIAGVGSADHKPVVLQRPAAVIGDETGRLYVADVSRQVVFVFDEKAGELLQWEQAEGLLNFVAPAGLALGPDGSLLVADAELALVTRLDRTGKPVAVIGRGVLRRPTGIARDAQRHRIYVADTYAHAIKVFDDDGRLVDTIGSRGTGDGQFNYPTHLAFAGDTLYVTDSMNNRVVALAGDGHGTLRRIGARGLALGDLVRPKGVGVDGEGNVYVVESLYDTLLVYSAEGEFLLPIGGSGTATGRFYLPAGVWVDARNRVYVADMFNGRVVLFQFLGGNDAAR
jgi:DNA-binding beta-propeller fold protein YncE